MCVIPRACSAFKSAAPSIPAQPGVSECSGGTSAGHAERLTSKVEAVHDLADVGVLLFILIWVNDLHKRSLAELRGGSWAGAGSAHQSEGLPVFHIALSAL